MPYAKTELRDDLPAHLESVLSAVETPIDRGPVGGAGNGEQAKESKSTAEPGKRHEAERLIGDIGSEFNKLRKRGRAAAWAGLEEKVAEGGALLISTGMITSKDWVGMLIDIEQFRKAEGGSEELPGDALAKWLSEPEKKPKEKKVN